MRYLKYNDLDSFNLAAYLFFIWFTILSVRYANARILISDPAFYLFNIINSSDFFVPGTRYTAVINQIFVVVAVQLKQPLNVLIPLYSISFVFIRLLYFIIVTHLLKNKAAGFAIIAFSVVGVAQSYFRPTSESTIAMLNSILLYAWLCYISKWERLGKLKELIGFVGALVLVVFGYLTHPVALFSLLFVVAYYAISEKKLKSVFPYVIVIAILGLFMHEVFIGSDNAHHESLYGNLFSSPLSILQELTSYYPYKFFDTRFKLLYRPLVLLFFAGILTSAINKKWLSLVFFIAYCGFYFIIICTSFKAGDSDMQMEKIFLPFAAFSALLFANVLKQLPQKYHIVLSIFVIILSVNANLKIRQAGIIYDGRITYLKEIIVKANEETNRKLVISKEQINQSRMVFSWAMGIETLMLSSMDDEMLPLTVFAAPQIEEVTEKMKQNENFMVAPFYTSFNYKNFNQEYFVLPENQYQFLAINFANYKFDL